MRLAYTYLTKVRSRVGRHRREMRVTRVIFMRSTWDRMLIPAGFESKVLVRVEGEAGRVIPTIVTTECMPEGPDFDVLLNFVALMAARTPRIRRLVGEVTDLVVKAQCNRSSPQTRAGNSFGIIATTPVSGRVMMKPSRCGSLFSAAITKSILNRHPMCRRSSNWWTECCRCWLSVTGRWGSRDLMCRTSCVLTPRYHSPRRIGFGAADEMHLANHHTFCRCR